VVVRVLAGRSGRDAVSPPMPGSMRKTPRRVQGGQTVQSRQRTSDSGH
jgi:hypothetical protein